MLSTILAGFADGLQFINILFVFLGVTIGIIAGAIPGINGPMAIALCIPPIILYVTDRRHRFSGRTE